MSATTQHLLGQLADGRFPLRKLLGVSQNSAVFLTTLEPERPGDPPPDAAIKLIPEDPAASDRQLEHWSAASALSHPGLLRIYHFGRCSIDGSPCLYIVVERADEDLGQLLPRRALTPEETSGMLAAILPTLHFLHENGYVHAGVKPCNIHATGDNVKLSTDRIVPTGESASNLPLAAPFAAPETVLFPASDMWSLGVSICETLSKILPQQRPSGRFVIPELPAPYAEVVRAALVDEPALRITLDQVRSALDPAYVAKRKPASSAGAAAQSGSAPARIESPYIRPPEAPNSPESLLAAVESPATAAAARTTQRPPAQIDPLALPLSPVSPHASLNVPSAPSRAPIPVSSLPQVNATIGNPRRVISPNPPARSNRLFVVSATAAVILALIFVPRLFLRSARPAPGYSNGSASTPAVNSRAAANPIPSASNSASSQKSAGGSTGPSSNASRIANPSPSAANANSSNAGANLNPRTDKTTSPAKSESANRSAAPRSTIQPPPAASTPSASLTTHAPSNVNLSAPTIVRKVLPQVSEKARNTIRGTVRVNVRVQLTPDGTVSSAELANPASSQFFADLALKAARQWQFSAASSSGASTPSTIIRFDFTPTATAAYQP